MILIGQYDSPFVRRVGIALRLYGMPFEHYPWSTFGDAEKLRRYNPLGRVPTLVLDDGAVLVESTVILDWLDELAGAKALIPARGPARREAMKVVALALGLADKAVSMFYERVMHKEPSAAWVDRCRAQVSGVLDALEADRAGRTSSYWFGDAIGHADIAVTCALRFLWEVHAAAFDRSRSPALAAHAEHCEARPEFREISQPFIPPA
jgi:glutathione S-transferase